MIEERNKLMNWQAIEPHANRAAAKSYIPGRNGCRRDKRAQRWTRIAFALLALVLLVAFSYNPLIKSMDEIVQRHCGCLIGLSVDDDLSK